MPTWAIKLSQVMRYPPSELQQINGVSRYMLSLTEKQLEYVRDLFSVDNGENAAALSSAEYSELADQLNWHYSGIHGPQV